jgi:dTDP-4-dehydrorhamnose reductase
MHNVEACEADPQRSFLVNGIGGKNLAQISNEVGYTLVHISTDYVFDGFTQVPYVEEDCPNPLNVYGNTKLSGEYFIKSIAEKYFILRLSGLYGINPCRAKGGLNFVSLMLKLSRERDEVRVVDDEILTPTYTGDIASQILHFVGRTDYGLYHVTSQGSCSWYEFASKIFELTNSSVCLSIADPGEFPVKVPRPKYSVLENKALQKAGIDIMPHWSTSLKLYLETGKDQI